MIKTMQKLKKLEVTFKEMHKLGFSELHQKVGEAKEQLKALESQLRMQQSDELREETKHALELYTELILREDGYLKQMAMDQWFISRDRNTKYFYSLLKRQRMKKEILSVKDDAGLWVKEENVVADQFVLYFNKLLGDDGYVLQFEEEIMKQGSVLSDEQRRCLLREYDAQEVKDALWDIADEKAPGIDGFTASFFKHSWQVVGQEITKVVLKFFETDKMLKEINVAIIRLIPKEDNPSLPSNFRPISCCSIIYKKLSRR